MDIIDEAKVSGRERQIELAHELFKIWADKVYEIGTVGLTPMVQGVLVVTRTCATCPRRRATTGRCGRPATRGRSSSSSQYRRLAPGPDPLAWLLPPVEGGWTMLVYIIKRLLLLPLLLFIFSVVAFILIQAPPGDFVTSYVAELAASGSSIDQQQIDALRNLYGLDQPITCSISNGFTPAAGRSRRLPGMAGADLGADRAALAADAGARPVHPPVHLRGGGADRHPLGDAPVFFWDYFFTVFNYLGVATPTFMTALVLMWLAFSHFGITITGLFSPDYVDAPWSLRAWWTSASTSGCRS